MRFLHSADWHIGKTLRGRSRLGEQEEVLEEILQLALAERVDCLLVAGDLFDSPAPSAEAERLVFDFWAELIGRQIPAVVIAGNHDHPKRLSALRSLVEPLHLWIRPVAAAAGEGGVLEVESRGEKAQIATLPFISERQVVTAHEIVVGEDEAYGNYEEKVTSMMGALCRTLDPDAIRILVAHFFVRGAAASGSERAIHVSSPYEVGAQGIPSSLQYAALGHLHRPQIIETAPVPTRYSGSTLQLDFGEQGQRKEVVIVDVRPGAEADVRAIRLSRGRHLCDIRGPLKALHQQSDQLGDAYFRVTVEVEEPVPGIAAQVRELIPDAVDIRVEFPRRESPSPTPRIGHLTPEAMFAEFYRTQHGITPPEEVGRLFRELYEEVTVEAH